MEALTGFRLYDKLQLSPGLFSHRYLLVYAASKHQADIVARLHHAAILHQLGVL